MDASTRKAAKGDEKRCHCRSGGPAWLCRATRRASGKCGRTMQRREAARTTHSQKRGEGESPHSLHTQRARGHTLHVTRQHHAHHPSLGRTSWLVKDASYILPVSTALTSRIIPAASALHSCCFKPRQKRPPGHPAGSSDPAAPDRRHAGCTTTSPDSAYQPPSYVTASALTRPTSDVTGVCTKCSIRNWRGYSPASARHHTRKKGKGAWAGGVCACPALAILLPHEHHHVIFQGLPEPSSARVEH